MKSVETQMLKYDKMKTLNVSQKFDNESTKGVTSRVPNFCEKTGHPSFIVRTNQSMGIFYTNEQKVDAPVIANENFDMRQRITMG